LNLLAAWAIKINTRFYCKPLPELIFQQACADFMRFAFAQFGELEWTKGNADQAIDHQAEMLKHDFDFAVFTFAQINSQPSIRALRTV
jgi:hypothetical protein